MKIIIKENLEELGEAVGDNPELMKQLAALAKQAEKNKQSASKPLSSGGEFKSFDDAAKEREQQASAVTKEIDQWEKDIRDIKFYINRHQEALESVNAQQAQLIDAANETRNYVTSRVDTITNELRAFDELLFDKIFPRLNKLDKETKRSLTDVDIAQELDLLAQEIGALKKKKKRKKKKPTAPSVPPRPLPRGLGPSAAAADSGPGSIRISEIKVRIKDETVEN
tara:strand:+ start:31555 stop:32229 length:675 start_codon:yes stop_codon:yes gene_type:complete